MHTQPGPSRVGVGDGLLASSWKWSTGPAADERRTSPAQTGSGTRAHPGALRHLPEMPQLGESGTVMHSFSRRLPSAHRGPHAAPRRDHRQRAAPTPRRTPCPVEGGGLQLPGSGLRVRSWPCAGSLAQSHGHGDLAPAWCQALHLKAQTRFTPCVWGASVFLEDFIWEPLSYMFKF